MSKLDRTVQKRKIAGNALICFWGGRGTGGGEGKKNSKKRFVLLHELFIQVKTDGLLWEKGEIF